MLFVNSTIKFYPSQMVYYWKRDVLKNYWFNPVLLKIVLDNPFVLEINKERMSY